MKAAVVVMLAAIGLAGCFGGGGDATDSDGADAESDVPKLPEGLEMKGAEEVSYTEASVVWRWEDAIGPSQLGPRGLPAALTTFDAPASVGLSVEANLTWRHGPPTDLGLRVEDDQGRVVCARGSSSYNVYPSVQPAAARHRREPALDEAGTWRIVVELNSDTQQTTPFSLKLRLSVDQSPVHQVADMVPFEVVSGDGTPLRGHVYLPEGQGPFASVLELSGYWGSTAFGYGRSDEQAITHRGRASLDGWLGHFADAGYAVALVNIRGTGGSGGCQDATGPRDVEDAGAVIEGLAEQPWSNGRVGMIGHSWPAVSQYVAVASGASALRAVVPSSGIADMWTEQTYDGALRTDAPQGLAYDAFGASLSHPPPTSRATCPEHPAELAAEALIAADGDRSSYFEARDHRSAINTSQVAFFVDHGMANGEFLPLRDPDLWHRISHANRTLWMAPWTHNQFPARADYFPNVLEWFDHHLRDGPRPTTTNTVQYQDTGGTWHRAQAWPPAGDQITLHLTDGQLVMEPNKVMVSQASFASSNQRAIPDTCGDKAIFTSAPLAEDVLIAGVYTANVTVSSTLPDGNFAANLWHLEHPWPCGQAPGTQGISGVRYADPSRGLQVHEVGFALSDLRHRGHRDVGSDYPTAAPDVMRMTSESFATFVPAGERLVLTVGGGDPWLLEDPRKPVLTVHTGPEVEGELVLNVVEGNLAFEGAGGAGTLVGEAVG